MDPSRPPPFRGRARGRAQTASTIPPGPEASAEHGSPMDASEPSGSGSPGSSSQAQRIVKMKLEDMYQDDAQSPKRPRTSSEEGSTSHSGGNGSSRGGGNGNGNGNGSARGGSPRGGGNGNGRGVDVFDFIRSRPSSDFIKKGTTANGGQARLIANYYGFKQHPSFKMGFYSIKVTPEVEEEKRIRQLLYLKRESIGTYLVTGLQLFTTKPIAPQNLQFEVTAEDQEAVTYKIEFDFKRQLGDNEPVVVQFYNLMSRKMQQQLKFSMLGRHYYDPQQKVPFDRFRLELWPGFQNSIRQQEAGLMMNVESVWKVLRTETILQKMTYLRQQDTGRFKENSNREIIGMVVVTTYNPRSYKVDTIDWEANPRSTFPTKTGEMSYVDYYKSKYNKTITNFQQPMLVSNPKERDIRRGQIHPVYLVPEFCYPCGLTEEMRSNFNLMKGLAGCLHMEPTKRISTMQQFVNRVLSQQDLMTTLKSWGIALKAAPVEVDGRFLKPEEILVGAGQKVNPDNRTADWTVGLRGVRMFSCNTHLQNWVILVGNREAGGVQNLVGTMQRVATPLGYNISRPTRVITVNGPRDYEQKITDVMGETRGKLDMIFVILMNNNLDTYSSVKKRCSVEYGIPSQCFLAKNLNSKGLMSIATKLVIQMSAKQGGEPWGVSNPLKTVMVLGYDVHHAGPAGGKSVAAMTATMTETMGSYYSTVSQLNSREEVTTAVISMFTKCLDAYERKNSVLPQRIFMYRDGVGEGQLKAVYEQELSSLREAIKPAYVNKGLPNPKLTYVVVNKRINTRFFEKLSETSYNNPKPGMVVDDVVTRPERYDFFLVSQTARQGCVSPTYYNVLTDESQLGPDKLQRFTWKLCHLYFNWSGTVAVPGPCQNAHKLALLVGTALKRPANSNLNYLLHFL